MFVIDLSHFPDAPALRVKLDALASATGLSDAEIVRALIVSSTAQLIRVSAAEARLRSDPVPARRSRVGAALDYLKTLGLRD